LPWIESRLGRFSSELSASPIPSVKQNLFR